MNNIKQITPPLSSIQNGTPGYKIGNKFFVGGIGGDYIPVISGVDTSDATAYGQHLLSGYTAYAKGVKISGTIQTIDSALSDPSISREGTTIRATYTVPIGYVSEEITKTEISDIPTATLGSATINKTGSQPGTINIISNVSNSGFVTTTNRTDSNVSLTAIESSLNAGNIASGATIFGIAGTHAGKSQVVTPVSPSIYINPANGLVSAYYTPVARRNY